VTKLTVVPNGREATGLAAQRLLDALAAGTRHLVLAGGNTPKPTYERLAREVFDWAGVELWLGDERMVPAGDERGNGLMIEQTLIARVAADRPPTLQRVCTERDGEAAAAEYAERFDNRRNATGFVALLGLGEDAHTASLFPNAPALSVTDRSCVAVYAAPKPPSDRVTLTLPAFESASAIVVLATGAAKAEAVAATLGNPDSSAPASLLPRKRLELIADEAAAGKLPADRRS
jgi:6-phosphogluconolactonase